MLLESLSNCKLYIGNYPKFLYDARGGGGKGILSPVDQNGQRCISFPIDKFSIPQLYWKTTRVLGIPLLPGLEIKILPESLKGNLDTNTMSLNLLFKAKFRLAIFNLIKAPPLNISTSLRTTNQHVNKLANINDTNMINLQTLKGTALVDKTGNIFLDAFLSLPCEATAELNCRLSNFN